MVWIKLGLYPKGTYNKLSFKECWSLITLYKVLKKINFDAYVLDLAEDMGISREFDISCLLIWM